VDGNVGQGGCVANPSNFFCFDNSAVPPTPVDELSGTLVFVFDVTLDPGNTWAGYNPSFRIDWVGPDQNNYSFVSEPIGVTQGCPRCTPDTRSVDVPEPASIAALGSGLVALAGGSRLASPTARDQRERAGSVTSATRKTGAGAFGAPVFFCPTV